MPPTIDEDKDEDELDDKEVFVEVKTARFLAALGLPPLDALPAGS